MTRANNDNGHQVEKLRRRSGHIEFLLKYQSNNWSICSIVAQNKYITDIFV